MPLYIKARREGPWREYNEYKLEAAYLLLKQFKDLVEGNPFTISIERDGKERELLKAGSFGELGARLKFLLNRVSKYSYDEITSTVIHMEFGIYSLRNKRTYPAYLEIYYDPSLRRIYGDIKLDLYATIEYSDIMEFFSENVKVLESALKSFIIQARELERAFRVIKIAVAENPDALVYLDVPTIYKYYRHGTSFVEELLTTALDEGPDRVVKKLKVYRKELLASRFWREKEFQRKIRSRSKSMGVETASGSLILYSRDPSSFIDLYHMLMKHVLMPLVDRLEESEDSITSKIQAIIRGL